MSSIQQTGRFLPFTNNSSNIQRKQLSTQGNFNLEIF
ncbi:GSCOCG00003653001-RA-CDS [Cotesia congregata]|nr:GSCOCG00003653001-RA-CDS [Cotesia congregata]